jgi:[acyl-carrier-protein] S-malonyltransferase
MGKDLAQRFAVAANIYAQADRQLGKSLSQISFEGPAEELTRTVNCQPALFVHGLATLAVLLEEIPGFDFAAAAGLSLGEFTAHCAAETFDFRTGLSLVAKRAAYMDEACSASSGTMAACVGGDETAVQALASEAGVDIANINAPGQIVLSGTSVAIAKAISLAGTYGVRRALPLTVAGAFHSRLMIPAEERLRSDFETVEMKSPKMTVVANVTAQPARELAEIRTTLIKQVSGSVRWKESIEYLLDRELCDVFIELGPGQVLAGLMQRIRKGVATISIGDLSSFEHARSALEQASS